MKAAITLYPVGLKQVRLVVLSLCLALAGCLSTQLISDYDEGIDKGVTDLQRSAETFLTKLEHAGRAAGPLTPAEQDFFDQTSVSISALQVRATAHPQNDLTSAQLALLKDSFITLEELLKVGITREQIPTVRNAINTSTAAILKLELAKKRGDTPAK